MTDQSAQQYEPIDLETAVENGDEELVRRMLSQNPGLVKMTEDEYDPDWPSPLHEACIEGYSGIVEVLLESGADTSLLWILDDSAWTPLRSAVNSCTTCAEILISHGADIQICESVTMLHQFAYDGDLRLVALLLANGVDLDIFAAAGLGFLSEVQVLLKSRASLATARLTGFEDEYGAEFHFGRGETALHWAARGCPAAISALCQARADVNAVSHRGEAAIHWAVESCQIDAVRELLAFGARPSVISYEGVNAIQLAEICTDEAENTQDKVGWTEIRDILRNHRCVPLPSPS